MSGVVQGPPQREKALERFEQSLYEHVLETIDLDALYQIEEHLVSQMAKLDPDSHDCHVEIAQDMIAVALYRVARSDRYSAIVCGESDRPEVMS